MACVKVCNFHSNNSVLIAEEACWYMCLAQQSNALLKEERCEIGVKYWYCFLIVMGACIFLICFFFYFFIPYFSLFLQNWTAHQDQHWATLLLWRNGGHILARFIEGYRGESFYHIHDRQLGISAVMNQETQSDLWPKATPNWALPHISSFLLCAKAYFGSPILCRCCDIVTLTFLLCAKAWLGSRMLCWKKKVVRLTSTFTSCRCLHFWS